MLLGMCDDWTQRTINDNVQARTKDSNKFMHAFAHTIVKHSIKQYYIVYYTTFLPMQIYFWKWF